MYVMIYLFMPEAKPAVMNSRQGVQAPRKKYKIEQKWETFHHSTHTPREKKHAYYFQNKSI